MLKRIISKKGFSLVESIGALLIVSLIGLIATGGVVLAYKTQPKISQESDAQVLISEYQTELRTGFGNCDLSFEPQEINIGTDEEPEQAVVFYSKKYKCLGAYSIRDNILTFVPCTYDESGNVIVDTTNTPLKTVSPRLNGKESINEEYYNAELEYSYDSTNKCFSAVIKIKSGKDKTDAQIKQGNIKIKPFMVMTPEEEGE